MESVGRWEIKMPVLLSPRKGEKKECYCIFSDELCEKVLVVAKLTVSGIKLPNCTSSAVMSKSLLITFATAEYRQTWRQKETYED